MPNGTGTAGRIKVFAYVTVDKATQYREIMRAFMDAKARFALHLRPAEILNALVGADLPEPMNTGEVDAALGQLCEWGNLERHQDTADVATVEEFYRPRYLYQLTAQGEAAERAIEVYWESVHKPGQLQAAALGDIRDLLHQIFELALLEAPDEVKVHLTLRTLRDRFEELTSQAQIFVGSLQRAIDLHRLDLARVLAYKQTLIEYLERFIGQLVVATFEVTDVLRQIEGAGIEKLLVIAARRDLVDALAPTDEDYQSAVRRWQSRWQGLRGWFVGRPDDLSQAEVLRRCARSAIPALLSAIAGIHDRRVTRTDRALDLRTLARWFAESDTDYDAHRLWRAAFGLTPSRHLRIDDDTLDERDANPVSPRTSWLDAPPLLISPRLRRTGQYTRRGRPNNVVDFSEEKAQLARLAEAEAEQITEAQRRLATGRRMRLSEIGRLDSTEFDLFLDLLGEALARKARSEQAVEAASTDGALRIHLSPTPDQAIATIHTSTGRFSGRDHFVVISYAAGDENEELRSSDDLLTEAGAKIRPVRAGQLPRKPR